MAVSVMNSNLSGYGKPLVKHVENLSPSKFTTRAIQYTRLHYLPKIPIVNQSKPILTTTVDRNN